MRRNSGGRMEKEGFAGFSLELAAVEDGLSGFLDEFVGEETDFGRSLFGRACGNVNGEDGEELGFDEGGGRSSGIGLHDWGLSILRSLAGD